MRLRGSAAAFAGASSASPLPDRRFRLSLLLSSCKKKKKQTQITRNYNGINFRETPDRWTEQTNPGFRLGIVLEVVGVEAVPLQEAAALPRRRRRGSARGSRGGRHGEAASGEAEGEGPRVWG